MTSPDDQMPAWMRELLTEASAVAYGMPNSDSMRRVLTTVPLQFLLDAGLTRAAHDQVEADTSPIFDDRADNHYGYCTLDPLHDGPCAQAGDQSDV
jgi:hypothetical protein